MNYSYYEVYTNALRAFTGMGFPYGADEDAAYIIAWLELNELNGIKLLANSINKIDKKFDGKINIKKNELNFNFKNSSVLMKGPGLVDFLYSKIKRKKKVEAIINNCLEAIYFVPLLYKITSDVLFINLIYLNNNNQKVLCIIKKNSIKIGLISKEVNINKSQVRILISNKYENIKLLSIKNEISNNSIQKNLSKSLKPKKKYWKVVEKIAHRTFVPESKESRDKGAGGGDDND